MKYEQTGRDITLYTTKNDLNLADTLDCGQAFRFERTQNGICGIANARLLTADQFDDKIIFYDMPLAEFETKWFEYFDLGCDYGSLKALYSSDETLKKAVSYCGGIHILKQDSFEALISFLISQNNNIPRIKGSIKRLCAKFGQKISGDCYAFPTISELAAAKLEDYADLGLGYRDIYLYETAQKAANGQIDFERIRTLPIDEARRELRLLKGVGPKVAECVLLFGFYRTEAFPIDTWIKKVLAKYYNGGFPQEFEKTAGIAQQYLFHYIRTSPNVQ